MTSFQSRGLFGPRKLRTIGLDNQGIFQPGRGIVDENVVIEPEINGPLDVPPNRQLPTLRTAPPNLGMSSYPDIEAYKNVLKSQPNRKDYELNNWGKLLAGVAATAEGYNRGVAPGLAVGEEVLNRRYNKALADWKDKTAGAGELANIEVKLDEINRKRTEDQYKIMYDINKQIMDFEKMASDLQYNDARISEIRDKIKNGNVEFTKEDGHGWLVHKDTGITEDLGPIGESKQEGRDRDWAIRQKELGTQLDNAIELERERQGGDIESIKQRFVGEESMLRLRYDLEKEMLGSAGVSAENYGKAFDLAVDEMNRLHPELTSQIMNPDGSAILDEKGKAIRPDLWEQYRKNVRERTQALLGWTGGQGSNTPKSGWPAQNTPINPNNRTRGTTQQEPPNIGAQINEALRLLAPNNPELQTDSVSRNRIRAAIQKDPQYLEKLRRELEAAQQGIDTSAPPVQLPPGASIPNIQLPPQSQPPLTFQGKPLNVAPPRYNGIFGPIDVPVGMGPTQDGILPLSRGERRAGFR